MTASKNPDFDQHNPTVCEVLAFLTSEFGFDPPVRDDSSSVYRLVSFSRPNFCLEFATEAEVLDRLGGQRFGCLSIPRPSSYATDEQGESGGYIATRSSVPFSRILIFLCQRWLRRASVADLIARRTSSDGMRVGSSFTRTKC